MPLKSLTLALWVFVHIISFLTGLKKNCRNSAQNKIQHREIDVFVVYMKCSQHRLNANKHLIRFQAVVSTSFVHVCVDGICVLYYVLLCIPSLSYSLLLLLFCYHTVDNVCVASVYCILLCYKAAAGVDMSVCFASLLLHVFDQLFFFIF